MKTKPQRLKNAIGELLGFGRCPVTGDSYWKCPTVSVPYSESRGIILSERALQENSIDEIMIALEKELKLKHKGFQTYSLEEIKQGIPSRCHFHQPNGRFVPIDEEDKLKERYKNLLNQK